MKKEEITIRAKSPRTLPRLKEKVGENKTLNLLLWVLEMMLFIWDMGKTLILIIAIAFVIRFYIIQPFYVEGQSMEPSFNNGEYLLIDEVSYHFRDPQRGEVIVFKPPINTYQNYIKRIIALPEEEISFEGMGYSIKNSNNKVSVLQEPYLNPEVITQGSGLTKLEENQFFVMGDNRTASSDSRSFGPVNKKNITGRVWFFIKTEAWRSFEIFGRRITIPKISSMGKLQKPNY